MNNQNYLLNSTNVKCWGCIYFSSGTNSIKHCINKMPCINNEKYRSPKTFTTNKIE